MPTQWKRTNLEPPLSTSPYAPRRNTNPHQPVNQRKTSCANPVAFPPETPSPRISRPPPTCAPMPP
eukprot:scaffold21719_cov191-Isochrysis_galbana.AAC.2